MVKKNCSCGNKEVEGKKEDDGALGTSPGWKNRRYFKRRIQVTSPCLYQLFNSQA